MVEIKVKSSPELRKGEAGTIRLQVPATEDLKSLKIELPEGVETPGGDEMLLAPKMEYVDIPIFVTQRAPDEFELEFSIVEQAKPERLSKVEVSKKHEMKLRK